MFVNQFGVELEEILETKTQSPGTAVLLSKPGVLMSWYACMAVLELS